MNIQTSAEIDLTIQSFAYVARQLAASRGGRLPSAPQEQLLGEAEKHRCALRLLQRDTIERAEQRVRAQALTKDEFQRMREAVVQSVAQAQDAISSIVAQYGPQKLAA